MEKNSIENIFAQQTVNARLTSQQTGGKSNEELWLKISENASSNKNIALGITKKLGIIIALSITAAAAAMYSGFRYYEINITEVPAPKVETIHHSAQPTTHEELQATDSIPAENLQPEPQPEIPKTVAHSAVLPKAAPVPETKIEIQTVVETEEIVQPVADTAKIVKHTVFKKPSPVTVQETKTKYVKKKPH